MRRIIAGSALILALALAGEGAEAQAKGEQKAGTAAPSAASGKGWLGVSIQDVTPRLARERDLKTKTGALINDVEEESPADKAGLKEDDVIVEFRGKTIDDATDLTDAVRSTPPATAAKVTLYRGGVKKTLQVTVGKERKRSYAYSYHITPPPHVRISPPRIPNIHVYSRNEVFGLSLTDIKGQLGAYFEAPNGRGVLVEEVEKKSAAERAGFMAGDVIIKIGKDQVETTADIMDAVEDVKEGEKLEFGVIRKGAARTLTLEADELSDARLEHFHGHGGAIEFRGEEFKKQMEMLKRELKSAGHESTLEFRSEDFKRQMEALKRELKSVGQNIRLQMEHLRETLRRELRSVTS